MNAYLGKKFIYAEGGVVMATNLTEEIRMLEDRAKKTLEDAKAQAGEAVSRARDEAERKVKEGRQALYRQFREKTEELERLAAEKAKALVEEGKSKADAFLKDHEGRLAEASKWVAEEVKSRYGRS